ncbi:MAG: hypothetical protein WCK98_02540 [bacterium]
MTDSLSDKTLERLENSEVFKYLVSILVADFCIEKEKEGLIQRTIQVIAHDCTTSTQTVLDYAKRKALIQKGN